MKNHTIETCKHCGEVRSTVWDGSGFTITQTHKPECPALEELKERYHREWTLLDSSAQQN